MKAHIREQLEKIIKKLTSVDVPVVLEIPADLSHGDYTTNVAFSLAKILKKSPIDVAKIIVDTFMIHDLRFMIQVEKVEALAPGFINFYLSQEYLMEHLQKLTYPGKSVPVHLEGGRMDSFQVIVSEKNKGKKVVVEYSSPNIAKPFTIGHLRSTIIGDAIANLLQATGYEVFRDNHLGDWGTQFGKQIYAIKQWGNEEEIEKSEMPVKKLVELYVKFHEEAEKDPTLDEQARKWFKKLEDGDTQARRLWQKCIDWSWKEFENIYQELNITFTENGRRGYGESFFEKKMEPVVKELKEKGLLKENDGAQLIFFPKDKYPPLMVIKSDGATLYATRDLATDKFRLEKYGKDILVINEVGAEQSLYWKQIFEAEYMLGWYTPGQRIHIGHGLVRFKEGKMSTRKGNTIWLADVLNEAKKRAFALLKHDVTFDGSEAISINKKIGLAAKKHVLGVGQQINITHDVAVGALKWNDLKRSAHLDVTFDWDEILSMQGNSGPYIQYAYARTQRILEKAKEHGVNLSQQGEQKSVLDSEEMDLLRKLRQFIEVVEKAASMYSPNTLTTYLFELAQQFNAFYQTHRILDKGIDNRVEGTVKNEPKNQKITQLNAKPYQLDPEEIRKFRLSLTAGVGTILAKGLHILGIVAPKEM